MFDDPEMFELRELSPIETLELPIVFASIARLPKAQLEAPVRLDLRALYPRAALIDPEVLVVSAFSPTAT